MKQCIEEIIAVCDKHGVVLSHQDSHGAFQFIKKIDLEGRDHGRTGIPLIEVYHDWLRDAELR